MCGGGGLGKTLGEVALAAAAVYTGGAALGAWGGAAGAGAAGGVAGGTGLTMGAAGETGLTLGAAGASGLSGAAAGTGFGAGLTAAGLGAAGGAATSTGGAGTQASTFDNILEYAKTASKLAPLASLAMIGLQPKVPTLNVPTPSAPPQQAQTPDQNVFKKKMGMLGDPTMASGAGGVPNSSLTLGKATVLGS